MESFYSEMSGNARTWGLKAGFINFFQHSFQGRHWATALVFVFCVLEIYHASNQQKTVTKFILQDIFIHLTVRL